ncbi:MAG TPA: hypothetical protein VHP81_07420, partial [Lachnospiraceae bacterium]|nr:hypothetical protein [Lachnospiraceae bacterium]
MIVNVLGTEYTISKEVSDIDDSRMKNSDGYCDWTTKQIKIAAMQESDTTLKDLTKYKNKVLRHEIIHAFFEESGLSECSDYARNEEMV